MFLFGLYRISQEISFTALDFQAVFTLLELSCDLCGHKVSDRGGSFHQGLKQEKIS